MNLRFLIAVVLAAYATSCVRIHVGKHASTETLKKAASGYWEVVAQPRSIFMAWFAIDTPDPGGAVNVEWPDGLG